MVCGRSVPVQTLGLPVEKRLLIMWKPRGEYERCFLKESRAFDSVLRMVWWWRNTKALHLVKQRGALQAKSSCCPSRTSELPICALASSENFSPHLVFKRRV